MSVRKRIRAEGRVQGVFFRDAVRRQAERRGVAGWIANRADGSVEAVFEGSPEDVEWMVEVCRDSPGHSHVSGFSVFDEDAEGLHGFEIR